MAQFDFLGTWNDSWSIVSAIVDPGDVCIIPDLYYDQPQPATFQTLDDVRNCCLKERVRQMYLSSKGFSVAPPLMRVVELGVKKGKYTVEDNAGGPLLVLVLPACYRYDAGVPVSAFDGGEGLHLSAGHLLSHRHYVNPTTNMMETASDRLEAGYKEVLRRVKTRLVCHRFHKPIWIGTDALNKVQENRATIHGFGLD